MSPPPEMRPRSSPTSLESILGFYTTARAEKYDESTFHQKLAAAVVKALGQPSMSAEPLKILDIATGTGLVALDLAARFGDKVKIIGLDASREMLSVAREKSVLKGISGVKFVEGDAEDVRSCLADEDVGDGFDRIVCSSAIAFLRPTASLLSWSHLLSPSPDSTIIFDVPSPTSSPRNLLLARLAADYGLTPRFDRSWMTSEASIRAAVEGTGRLVVQSLTPTGILSRKTLSAAEGKATWEESLKISNMNPFFEALSRGAITTEQFVQAGERFVEGWRALGQAMGGEIEDSMENWIVVCALNRE